MMKRAAFAVSVASLLWSAHGRANEQDVRVLPPSTVWVLDFADERCSLIREFADGEDTVRLQVDAYGPGPGYVVTISGDLVPGSPTARIAEFRVGYSPDTGERERMSMLVGKLGEHDAVSFGPGFLPDAPWVEIKPLEFERSVDHLTVDFRLHKPFRLDTGNMAAPFAGMQQCVDDLLASWGIDPAAYRAQSRPPMLLELPEGYETVEVDLEETHPGPKARRYRPLAEARAQEREGPVPRAGFASPVRVMIDAGGQPTACVVQAGAASEVHRRSVCEKLAGPYQPALDAEGRPVASFVQTGMNQSAVQLAAD